MQRRCAWCGRATDPREVRDEEEVTHGICLECTENLLEQARCELGEEVPKAAAVR